METRSSHPTRSHAEPPRAPQTPAPHAEAAPAPLSDQNALRPPRHPYKLRFYIYQISLYSGISLQAFKPRAISVRRPESPMTTTVGTISTLSGVYITGPQ